MKYTSRHNTLENRFHTEARVVLLVLLSSIHALTNAEQDETELFSTDGYRIAEFRAPVPDSVPQGTTISTLQLQEMIKRHHMVLIDVMPAPVKPEGGPKNLLWLPPARYNIPGSHWLPNVGYGALSLELENYFKDNLERLSNSDKSTKIVIYCLAECWMSWNAAKRAAEEYGYSNIYWFPDGTTGWEAAELPLEKSKSIPMQ